MKLFILVLVIGVSCNANQKGPNNQFQTDVDDYYPSFNFSDTFDWKLLKAYAPKYKNVVLSPISLKIILSLLYQGSSAATARELQNVMQFVSRDVVRNDSLQILESLKSTAETLVDIQSSIFLDYPIEIKEYFQDVAKRYFKTDVTSTNFSNPEESSNDINRWVKTATHGRVKKIINPNELERTIMIITNAVYFKGTWLHKFPKEKSYIDTFYHSTDYEDQGQMLSLAVPYMTVTDEFFYYESNELDCKIIRLPYVGDSYGMFIVLPNSLGGLSSLIRKINLTKVLRLRYALQKRVVEVHMPKFKFSFQAKFAKVLEDFGLHQMFQNTASFTGIVKGNRSILRQIVVSDIVQKSGIDIDEEGTVAYSATEIKVGNKVSEAKEYFNATHPFLFFIEGPEGIILYIGKIENPLEEDSIPLPSRAGIDDNDDQQVARPVATIPSPPQQSYPAFSNSDPIQGNIQPLDKGQSGLNLSPVDLSPSVPDSNSYTPPVDKETLTYTFGLFDLELLTGFTDHPLTNVFISPASLKATLAMLLEGAKGKTAEELKDVLRIPDSNQKETRQILMTLINNLNERSGNTYLENHNAIFPSKKYRLLNNYRNKIRDDYKGTVLSVNYENVAEAANTINDWISDSTQGLIREAVSPQSLSSETSVVVSNALYFKGQWKNKFNPDNTRIKCFKPTPTECVNVPMMSISKNFSYGYISKLRAHAVEIPYEGKFSMLILLPNEDSNVRTLVRDIGHSTLTDILQPLRPTDVILEIPKFSFEYSVDMVEHLKALKVRELFTSNANLTGIIENGNVVVNNFLQKTKIIVDEEGTVAAASSNAQAVLLHLSTVFTVDRPFIMFIFHQDTANIIFEGIIVNPQEQAKQTPVPVTISRHAFNIQNRFYY